jgi:hypothetical protein
MRTAIFVFAISLLFPFICPAQTCSQNAIQRAAENAKLIHARLLAIKGTSQDEIDYDVTPATHQLIRAMKDALTTATNEYLQCESGNSADAQTIETALANLIGANAPESVPQSTSETTTFPDHIFGDDLRISVTHPDSSPQLVAMKASFTAGSCGVDTMLLIYAWGGKNWNQMVRWQSNDDSSDWHPFGDFFEFAVLPQKESGRWLLAVAHGFPWCTSRWSGYSLDLIKPAQNSAPLRTLVHKNAGYVRGDIDPTLKAVPGGFELRLQTGQLDLEYMTRLGIYRYRVIGDSLQRVQPIALNGKDFVDEWLQSDWSDAIHWSATTHLGDLQNVHAEVAKRIAPKSGDDAVLSYGPVRACSGDPKHFQVEFDRDPGKPTYFQIEQGENSFTMLDASPTPNSHCKGVDLMQKQ